MLHRTPGSRPGHRTLTFLLPEDHGAVSVVGNFNDWTPGALVLTPDGLGWVSASVDLPFEYIAVFRYLGRDGWWFDELDADRIDGGGSVVFEAGDAERAGLGEAIRLGVEEDVAERPETSETGLEPEATVGEETSTAGQDAVPHALSPAQRAVAVMEKRHRKAQEKADKAARKAAKESAKLEERRRKDAEKQQRLDRKEAERQERKAREARDKAKRKAARAAHRAEEERARVEREASARGK